MKTGILLIALCLTAGCETVNLANTVTGGKPGAVAIKLNVASIKLIDFSAERSEPKDAED